MIRLTKLNGEAFILNCRHIERVEMIPESKIILENGKYYLVAESVDEIIRRTIEYNGQIQSFARQAADQPSPI